MKKLIILIILIIGCALCFSCSTGETHQFLYGISFVSTSDLPIMNDLGIEVVSQVFPYDGSPQSWLAQLDQAQNHNIRVIAWLFPQGWEWDGKNWEIDDQSRSFLQTVSGHPALFAVYALEEPYWQGCWNCGYTTYQQQILYNKIKEIADVPIFSDVDSMSFWTAQGEETAFADGICDYCATWYYPFTVDRYERDKLVQQLQDDLTVAHERAPKSKIVWYIQAFAQNLSGHRMPTEDEMRDVASLVFDSGVDGAIWYVWTFNSTYDDFLVRHPELFAAVKNVYQK